MLFHLDRRLNPERERERYFSTTSQLDHCYIAIFFQPPPHICFDSCYVRRLRWCTCILRSGRAVSQQEKSPAYSPSPLPSDPDRPLRLRTHTRLTNLSASRPRDHMLQPSTTTTTTTPNPPPTYPRQRAYEATATEGGARRGPPALRPSSGAANPGPAGHLTSAQLSSGQHNTTQRSVFKKQRGAKRQNRQRRRVRGKQTKKKNAKCGRRLSRRINPAPWRGGGGGGGGGGRSAAPPPPSLCTSISPEFPHLLPKAAGYHYLLIPLSELQYMQHPLKVGLHPSKNRILSQAVVT